MLTLLDKPATVGIAWPILLMLQEVIRRSEQRGHIHRENCDLYWFPSIIPYHLDFWLCYRHPCLIEVPFTASCNQVHTSNPQNYFDDLVQMIGENAYHQRALRQTIYQALPEHDQMVGHLDVVNPEIGNHSRTSAERRLYRAFTSHPTGLSIQKAQDAANIISARGGLRRVKAEYGRWLGSALNTDEIDRDTLEALLRSERTDMLEIRKEREVLKRLLEDSGAQGTAMTSLNAETESVGDSKIRQKEEAKNRLCRMDGEEIKCQFGRMFENVLPSRGTLSTDNYEKITHVVESDTSDQGLYDLGGTILAIKPIVEKKPSVQNKEGPRYNLGRTQELINVPDPSVSEVRVQPSETRKRIDGEAYNDRGKSSEPIPQVDGAGSSKQTSASLKSQSEQTTATNPSTPPQPPKDGQASEKAGNVRGKKKAKKSRKSRTVLALVDRSSEAEAKEINGKFSESPAHSDLENKKPSNGIKSYTYHEAEKEAHTLAEGQVSNNENRELEECSPKELSSPNLPRPISLQNITETISSVELPGSQGMTELAVTTQAMQTAEPRERTEWKEEASPTQKTSAPKALEAPGCLHQQARIPAPCQEEVVTWEPKSINTEQSDDSLSVEQDGSHDADFTFEDPVIASAYLQNMELGSPIFPLEEAESFNQLRLPEDNQCQNATICCSGNAKLNEGPMSIETDPEFAVSIHEEGALVVNDDPPPSSMISTSSFLADMASRPELPPEFIPCKHTDISAQSQEPEFQELAESSAATESMVKPSLNMRVFVPGRKTRSSKTIIPTQTGLPCLHPSEMLFGMTRSFPISTDGAPSGVNMLSLGQSMCGLAWTYVTHTPADEDLMRAGIILCHNAANFDIALPHSQATEFQKDLPIIISNDGSLVTPVAWQSEGTIVAMPSSIPEVDMRCIPPGPDYQCQVKLAEYQAVERLGKRVWRHDRDLLTCNYPGCKKLVSDYNPCTLVCLRCGPKTTVRYCQLAHQIADLYRHNRECGSRKLLIKSPMDSSTAPMRFRLLCPAIRSIAEGKSSQSFDRQRLYSMYSRGVYTLFGPYGDQLPITWPDDHLECCRSTQMMERLLNYAFYNHQNEQVMAHLFRLLRRALELSGQWCKATRDCLITQWKQEWAIDLRRSDDDVLLANRLERYAIPAYNFPLCGCDWFGEELPPSQHIPRCPFGKGSRKPLGCLRGVGEVMAPAHGIRCQLDLAERKNWALRAWRQRHPKVESWIRRAKGEGFKGVDLPDGWKPYGWEGWTGWGMDAENQCEGLQHIANW